jgi:hypothetical protein
MLTRYQYPDAYTLEELQREYAGCDWRGRIRLLRLVLRTAGLPDTITAIVFEDDDVQVRQWLPCRRCAASTTLAGRQK